MTPINSITLLHFAGFITGISLYTMLGVMTLTESSRRVRFGVSLPADLTPLVTALLGLMWSAGGLWIYALPEFGFTRPTPMIMAVAFGALGFLPAVTIQVAAGAVSPAMRRALSIFAYTLAAGAALLHVVDATLGRTLPSNRAFLVLSASFAVIIVVLLIFGRQKQSVHRALPAAALGAFAVMSLHLTEHGTGGFGWLTEVAGHHISLLLAVAILAQDYRFALVDIFLKRALAMSAVVASTIVMYVLSIGLLTARTPLLGPTDPRVIVLVAAIAVVTILLFSRVTRAVAWIVDRFLLRRVDYDRMLQATEATLLSASTVDEVLDRATAAIERTLTADSVSWHPSTESPIAELSGAIQGVGRSSASIGIATTDLPHFRIVIGTLSGGRRLLSDDLQFLERIARMTARRIDVLRVTRERYERLLRENEMVQLATEAELRALRAQLKPHFLFNALTTIGHLIRESPDRAIATLYQLTGLLRAVLTRTDADFVTLGEELDLVSSYLLIESARFEERLRFDIDVHPDLRRHRIPTLILQALVENAIKHGLGPKRDGGHVRVTATLLDDEHTLELIVTDTGVGVGRDALEVGKSTGIGLSNIERRLERHFGERATLDITSDMRRGTTVRIRLPIAAAVSSVRDRARAS